jgi:hypothetical protein
MRSGVNLWRSTKPQLSHTSVASDLKSISAALARFSGSFDCALTKKTNKAPPGISVSKKKVSCPQRRQRKSGNVELTTFLTSSAVKAISFFSDKVSSPQISLAIATAVSDMRFEKPHSLSYHDSTEQSVPSITLVWSMWKMDECESWLKSIETFAAFV